MYWLSCLSGVVYFITSLSTCLGEEATLHVLPLVPSTSTCQHIKDRSNSKDLSRLMPAGPRINGESPMHCCNIDTFVLVMVSLIRRSIVEEKTKEVCRQIQFLKQDEGQPNRKRKARCDSLQ